MAKYRGKVVNTTTSGLNTVTNSNHPLIANGRLTFDFTYFKWLHSISNRQFTNMLRDELQFTEYIIQIFREIIPIVQDCWNIIRTNGAGRQFPHCHSISNDKLTLVNNIVQEIHGKTLCDEVHNGELNYWQLGITQSLRMITVYSHYNNTMYPVFLDYHHQIYPSVKYNEIDISAYRFCAYTRYS